MSDTMTIEELINRLIEEAHKHDHLNFDGKAIGIRHAIEFIKDNRPALEAKPVLRFRMCTPEAGMTIYTLIDVNGERAWLADDDFWVYDKESCIKFAASLGLPCTFEEARDD